MRCFLPASLLAASSAAALATAAQAAEPNAASSKAADRETVSLITVVGKRPASDVPGSVELLTKEDLDIHAFADIHRTLRTVTGVNLQEEDGFGLRPNIGLRGSGTDRSSKVVIMEDGVPVAPAPYASPSAYYFPTAARMDSIEITKGPGVVRYGPNTTAGAIHFFSTPVPDEASGRASLYISDFGRAMAHAYAGTTLSPDQVPFDIGFLVETYQDETDGFKDVPGGETGFDIEDYVLKARLSSRDGAAIPQSLTLKFQHSEQVSDESYLGLTQDEFDRSSYGRYAASQNDRFLGDHDTYQATYNATLGQFDVTALAYRTEFARNWRKLDVINAAAFPGLTGCGALDTVLRDPVSCAPVLTALGGPEGYVSADDAFGLRANNRAYEATGFQLAVGTDVAAFGLDHALTASVRVHEDEEDRFQDDDLYRMDNGTLVLTTDNAPGTQANRLSDAEAIAFYIEDQITAGPWEITAGLRVEDVTTSETRWNAPERTAANESRYRENSYTEAMPSLAVLYRVDEQISVFGGVHRGFAPAGVGSTADTDPEESTIYEVGGRYAAPIGQAEAVVFFNDYENLIGACTNSTSGVGCDIGDSFNAGEVDVYGIELSANTEALQFLAGSLTVPLGVSYTFTQTEFQTSVDSDFFGDVEAGAALPYVPEHQFALTVGATWGDVSADALIAYVGETRNAAGDGAIPADELIDSRTLLDASVSYQLTDTTRLRLKAENLFDETYLASRQPYGLRPGKPRELFAGIVVDF